jgi:hypothetical protein
MLLEVGLIGIQHTVEPWQQLLCAVIGMKDDRNAVYGSNRADVVCGSNSTGDGGLLLVILDTL